jgi:hypothetical protein
VTIDKQLTKDAKFSIYGSIITAYLIPDIKIDIAASSRNRQVKSDFVLDERVNKMSNLEELMNAVGQKLILKPPLASLRSKNLIT